MKSAVARSPGTGNRSAAADGRPSSVGQEALWFLHALAPDSSAYNVTAAMNLHFPVDAAMMATAVRRAVSGHAVLTDVFRFAGGAVRRFRATGQQAEPEFEVLELPDADDASARRHAQDLSQRPFRLDQRPPVRIALLRRSAGRDILLVATHHIVADDVSQLLLFRDVLDEYAALARGAEPPSVVDAAVVDTAASDTAVVDTAFDDFVDRQRAYLASPRAEAARTYWRGELEGLPDGDCLPTDRPRPAVHRFEGTAIDFDLPPDVLARVERAAHAHNATVFGYLLSVFQVLLYTAGGGTDCLIGYPATQRSRRLRGSVGYFVNTLPFRGRLDPDDSFDEVLRRTTRTLWRGLMHRELPFAMMPQPAGARRDPSRPGLLSLMFVMNAVDPAADPFLATVLPGRRAEHAGLAVSRFDVPEQHGQVDLTMFVLQSGAHARATLKYNTSLYTARTARSLADAYVRLLTSAAGDALPAALRELAGPNTEREETPMDQGTVIESTDRLAQVRDIASDVLSAEPEEVEAAQSFKEDLDADSLLAIELLTRLEKHFDVVIPESELPRLVTNLRTAYEVVAESAGW